MIGGERVRYLKPADGVVVTQDGQSYLLEWYTSRASALPAQSSFVVRTAALEDFVQRHHTRGGEARRERERRRAQHRPSRKDERKAERWAKREEFLRWHLPRYGVEIPSGIERPPVRPDDRRTWTLTMALKQERYRPLWTEAITAVKSPARDGDSVAETLRRQLHNLSRKAEEESQSSSP
jgi:hypothetical protein